MAVLAGFLLLAPPLYFLGPFTILMLLAGPRSAGEIVALLAAGVGVVVSLTGPAGLGPGLLKASGVAMALAFGLLSTQSRRPVLARAGLALAVGAVALGIWCWSRGIFWPEIERTLSETLVETYRAIPALARDPGGRQELEKLVGPAIEAAPKVARVLPGLLGLQALAGMGLAALWQHRLARRPTGPDPLPFREFRFNDHLIWGAIFTLALLLAPLPPEAGAFAINLLVVWAGLYGFRGLAIVTAFLARASIVLRVALAVGAVLLNPVALGVCLAIGLADTWLDIRRRLLPPAPEGAS